MRTLILLVAFACFSSFIFYGHQKVYPIDMTDLAANLYTRQVGPNKEPFEEKLYIYNPDGLVLVNYDNLSNKGVIVTTQKDYFIKHKLTVLNHGSYYLLSLHVLARENNTLTLNIDGATYDGTVLNDTIGAIGVRDDDRDILLSVKKSKFVYTKMLKQYY